MKPAPVTSKMSDYKTKAHGCASDGHHTDNINTTEARVDCGSSGRSVGDNSNGDISVRNRRIDENCIATASCNATGNYDDTIYGECRISKGNGHADNSDALVSNNEDHLYEHCEKQVGCDDENEATDDSTTAAVRCTSCGDLSASYASPANTCESNEGVVCSPEAPTNTVYYTNCSMMTFRRDRDTVDDDRERLDTCYRRNGVADAVYYSNCCGQGAQYYDNVPKDTLPRGGEII